VLPHPNHLTGREKVRGNMNFEDTLKEDRLIGEETDRKSKRVFFWEGGGGPGGVSEKAKAHKTPPE
jgi:hypothetical protein